MVHGAGKDVCVLYIVQVNKGVHVGGRVVYGRLVAACTVHTCMEEYVEYIIIRLSKCSSPLLSAPNLDL